MDYTALVDEVLVFPAGSVQGDAVCVNISINNDNVLEMDGENFFINITSDNVISAGLKSATVHIQENEQGI